MKLDLCLCGAVMSTMKLDLCLRGAVMSAMKLDHFFFLLRIALHTNLLEECAALQYTRCMRCHVFSLEERYASHFV